MEDTQSHFARMSDWVKLNVGGQIFQTTRTTLLSEPDSMLANMFSNDHLEPCHRDEQGNYLIDRNPKYFEPLLNYLRNRELVIDPGVNVRGVYQEARYFGIESVIPALKKMLRDHCEREGFQDDIRRELTQIRQTLHDIKDQCAKEGHQVDIDTKLSQTRQMLYDIRDIKGYLRSVDHTCGRLRDVASAVHPTIH